MRRLAPCALLLAATVHADSEPIWYGWQHLLVDVAVVPLAATTNDTANLLGVFLYAGVPLIDLAHGEGQRGQAASLIRGSFLLIGGLAGVETAPRSTALFAGFDHFARGAFAGMLAAMVVDDLLLGGSRVRATVTPGADGALFGVAGRW